MEGFLCLLFFFSLNIELNRIKSPKINLSLISWWFLFKREKKMEFRVVYLENRKEGTTTNKKKVLYK